VVASFVVGLVVMGGALADVGLWAGELSALHEQFVHRFNRQEPRNSAPAHMRGLIAPLERNPNPYRLRRLSFTGLRMDTDVSNSNGPPTASMNRRDRHIEHRRPESRLKGQRSLRPGRPVLANPVRALPCATL
jgi:hypothetical protein